MTARRVEIEIMSEILEIKKTDSHTHIDETGGFSVTRLISDVEYFLESNRYFTDWAVTGLDCDGKRHTFQCIGRTGTFGESRFYGRF